MDLERLDLVLVRERLGRSGKLARGGLWFENSWGSRPLGSTATIDREGEVEAMVECYDIFLLLLSPSTCHMKQPHHFAEPLWKSESKVLRHCAVVSVVR